MKFTVYHAIEPTFGFGDTPKFPEAYDKVAVLEADELKDTFRITNHIEGSWTKNPEVREICKPNPRSTSVGDVVIGGDGKTFRCEMTGWKEIA